MRECIYCGKTLEKGEKCSCAMSVAKRMEKEKEYELKDDTKKKAKKEKREKKERIKRAKPHMDRSRIDAKNAFARAWQLFVSFLKAPIDTVMNPGEMSWATIIILTALEGLVIGISIFAVTVGSKIVPFAVSGNMNAMDKLVDINSWNIVTVPCASSSASVAAFFLLSTLFYVVNRVIIRQYFSYHEFVKRFAFVLLPVAMFAFLSIIFGVLSIKTFVVLILCGFVGSVIIIYEILRSLWYNKTPGKTMYLIMICLFVFFMISIYLINFIKIA